MQSPLPPPPPPYMKCSDPHDPEWYTEVYSLCSSILVVELVEYLSLYCTPKIWTGIHMFIKSMTKLFTYSSLPCWTLICLRSSSCLLMVATQRVIIASIIGACLEKICSLLATLLLSLSTESNSSHRELKKSSPSASGA